MKSAINIEADSKHIKEELHQQHVSTRDVPFTWPALSEAVKVEESESYKLTKETFNNAPKEWVQQAKFRVTIGDSSADDVKDEEPSEKLSALTSQRFFTFERGGFL